MVNLPPNDGDRQFNYTDLSKRWYSRQLWNIGWNGISMRLARLEPHDAASTVTAKEDVVVLHVAGDAYLERQYDGRWKGGKTYPGNLSIGPRNHSSAWRFRGQTVTCLYLQLSPEVMRNLAASMGKGDPSRIELIETFNIRDPFIEHMAANLMGELQSAGPIAKLYGETFGRTIGMHLLRYYSPLVLERPSDHDRLSNTQFKQVESLIEERLQEDISLDDMASAAGLSASHFNRQFKHTTGHTPYQYVIQRRVERAKWMLMDGRYSVAETARWVGFTDQSHLARHFKSVFGVTPFTVARQGRRLN